MMRLFLQEPVADPSQIPPGARAFGGHNSTAAHLNSMKFLYSRVVE